MRYHALGVPVVSRRRVRLSALVLALVVLFAPQAPAHAATEQASGYRVFGDVRCSWGQTWVTNEWGSPGLQSVATVDESRGGWCNITNAVAGANEILVQQDLIAWDARGWEFRCGRQGPWVTNHWGPSHEVWTSFAWGSKPCNSQWYRGDGRAAVWLRGIYAGADRPPVGTGWVFVP